MSTKFEATGADQQQEVPLTQPQPLLHTLPEIEGVGGLAGLEALPSLSPLYASPGEEAPTLHTLQ